MHRIAFGLFLLLLLPSTAGSLELSEYLKPDEKITSNVSILYAGTNYTLVFVNGIETFLLKIDKFVEDGVEVENVLMYRCFLTSYPSRGDLEDIRVKLDKFTASRNGSTPFGPAEDVCTKLTGQDKKDCADVNTCIQACNLVMPYCFEALQAFKLPFAEALFDFSNAKKGLDGNYSAALTKLSFLAGVSFDQLNFNVTAELSELYAKIAAMQMLVANMSSNKLFVRAKDGGYEHCPPIPFDVMALNSAYAKVSALLSAAACFDDVPSLSVRVVNRTAERIAYYMATRERAALEVLFDEKIAEYNNLTVRAVAILRIFRDERLPRCMSDIEQLASQFRGEIARAEYGGAASTMRILAMKIAEYADLINASEGHYRELVSARASARDDLERAEIVVPMGDPSHADVVAARETFVRLEGALPINYTEKDEFVSAYLNVSNTTSAAAQRALATAAARAPSVIAGAAREISLAILRAIEGPLAIREAEKRNWMAAIPLVVLIVADVAILAVVFVAWFTFVWRRADIFLRARILRMWTAIFAGLTVILALATVAVNTMLAGETGKVSFATFWNAARGHAEARIIIQRAANESAVPLESCATKLAAALAALNISTMRVSIVDGVCEGIPAECLAVADVPHFKLMYGVNETTFYTFYKIEAEISGDESYFEKCTIAKLIK